MERVSIIEHSRKPVIFVAPHGAPVDDFNTDIITETAAEAMECYAVINRGWERADVVDYYKDKANCNDINHCHEDVIKDEFFDPIMRFKNRIHKKYTYGFMFTIHGASNDVKKKASDPDLGMVIGYGAGNPNSYTCKLWMKDFLVFLLEQSNIKAYGGKAGGNYAGWSKNNLNQLFRRWHSYADATMYCMQLEIARSLRDTRTQAEFIGEVVASAVDDLVQHGKWTAPDRFGTKEI
jgi:hypothetical protein